MSARRNAISTSQHLSGFAKRKRRQQIEIESSRLPKISSFIVTKIKADTDSAAAISGTGSVPATDNKDVSGQTEQYHSYYADGDADGAGEHDLPVDHSDQGRLLKRYWPPLYAKDAMLMLSHAYMCLFRESTL